MQAWTTRVGIALCAFVVGLAASLLVRAYGQPEEQPPVIEEGCRGMAAAASGPLDAAYLPTPSYCDLVKHADCYDGQIVRFKSKLDFCDEGMYFYDDACASGENRTAGEIAGLSYQDFNRILGKACGGLCAGPLDVVVSGKFEKVIPSGESNLLWDIYPLHFRVMSLEKVSSPR